mmetsp:Transcript_9011/g.8833  ORF Transcript_9011/g.8833 Transcript_9011/m.8833 type:complete len:157 (-) Transcript_9011:122-592(-)
MRLASPAAVAFSLHLLVLVNAVLYIIPLVAYVAHIPSMVFYRMTFMGSAFVCIYTIWTNYGLPPVRSGMQAFQMWMSRVTLGADFPFLFMSLLLATGSFMPNIFGLFVIVRQYLSLGGTLGFVFSNPRCPTPRDDEPKTLVLGTLSAVDSRRGNMT